MVLSSALACLALVQAAPLPVDPDLAARYFEEARVLCEREGGRLWGKTLLGPMVFVDAATKTLATNEPEPTAPRPPALGFANAAMDWGGKRWSTFVWSMLPRDDAQVRGRLLVHELYHRIQPGLGLFVGEGQNQHLDTLEGRVGIQLEWRALAQALGSSGEERLAAIGDALAFRAARRALFPDSAIGEQRLEMNEGVAQYTGTVVAAGSEAAATADAIRQLADAAKEETFLRTAAYPTGAAYGILLDGHAPGWTRELTASDDLGALLAAAAGVEPSRDLAAAEVRHGGAALRVAEAELARRREQKIAELRKRYVEGPVLVFPNGRNAVSVSRGMTPIPGVGTVVPGFRVTAEWGSIEAEWVLLSVDRKTVTVPAPFKAEGSVLKGGDWSIQLAAGWGARTGARAGDFELGPESR